MQITTLRILFALLLMTGLGLSACSEETEEGTTDDVEAVEDAADATDATDAPAAGDAFVSEEGGFSIAFPADVDVPTMQTVPVPTEIGNIDMNMYLVDAGTKAYMTAFADYPDALMAAVSDKKVLLDEGRDGALRNIGGTLISERDYDRQGYQAKEFYGKGMQGGQEIFVRANILMAGSRLYQVLYLSFDQDELDSQEADDYVNSFTITETADADDAEEMAEEEAEG